MREILIATSALILLGTGIGFAQDRVYPGTGQFETQDLSDDPRPDFVEPADPGMAADDGILPLVPGLTDQQLAQRGNCVRVQPGTGQFEPSDPSDSPVPDFVDIECPEGMVFGDPMATGAIPDTTVTPGNRVDPGTGQFEASDPSDVPVPTFVEPVQ